VRLANDYACPQAGPSLEDRINATARMLAAACREAGHSITGDGRVGDGVAAELLGFTASTLANWRSEGKGPRHYRIGGYGHRVTYRLTDLAAWIEQSRFDHFTDLH